MRELEKIKKERAEQREKEVCSPKFTISFDRHADESRNKSCRLKNRRNAKSISHEGILCLTPKISI